MIYLNLVLNDCWFLALRFRLQIETHIYFSSLIRSVIVPRNIFGLAVVNLSDQDEIQLCTLQCLVYGVCNP
jgi:hypothetical protein